MPNLLSDMTIDEISLVDDPANEQARVVIVKARRSKAPASDDVEDGDVPDNEDDESMDAPSLVRRMKKMLQSADLTGSRSPTGGNPETFLSAADAAEQDALEFLMDIEQITKSLDEAEAKIETVAKAAEDAQAEIVRLNAEIDAKDAEIAKLRGGEPAGGEEDIFKSLPEAIRKRFEEAEAAAKSAEQEVAKMKADHERVESIAKAREVGFGDPETVGPLLLRVRKGETTEADAETLEGILKSAAAVDRQSGVFQPAGVDRAREATDQSGLDAAADEIQKANSALTREQAIAKALEANPALYADYVAKRRAA